MNGILLPGGAGDYLDLGNYVYEKLIEYNAKGSYYPLWGTCLGFENLAIFASSDGDNVLSNLESHQSLPLTWLVDDPKVDTLMFSAMQDSLTPYTTEAMLYNSHSYGLALETFTSDSGLGEIFKATSMQTDPDTGATFVGTMEGKTLPFYGTQFHPEKVLTMYNNDELDHKWDSVNYNRYFAERFLEMARMNTNSCGTFAEC